MTPLLPEPNASASLSQSHRPEALAPVLLLGEEEEEEEEVPVKAASLPPVSSLGVSRCGGCRGDLASNHSGPRLGPPESGD